MSLSNDDATGRLMDDWIRGQLDRPTSDEADNARRDDERTTADQAAASAAWDRETERIAARIRADDGLSDPPASDPEHVSLDGGVRGLPIDPRSVGELADEWIRNRSRENDLKRYQ